jgi:acetyltransferase-like isoleucine patch superfamily enzyme
MKKAPESLSRRFRAQEEYAVMKAWTMLRATTGEEQLQTETDWKVERMVVKRGASIGSGATILSNVVIGENAIVDASSVVTKDVPANAIVAGNPAKLLRYITLEARNSQ